MAFKIAGSLGFKEGTKRAHPILLEPVMAVEVVVPESYVGEVTGDLSSRRGKILNLESRSGLRILEARVPLAEMFGYATQLRSSTQGRATYTMQFSHYERVPAAMAEEAIQQARGTEGAGRRRPG
jgi:elongation factor G